jgi:hypothetical protein
MTTWAIGLSGCATLAIPELPTLPNLPGLKTRHSDDPNSRYVGLESGFESDPSLGKEIYNKVRQARAQNSVVLQVVGDDEPFRILPLPPDERSVFVSDLLKQTGVLNKLGAVDAVLYRQAPGTINGLRMVVQMSIDKRTVRPESDYALKPGDRLRVEKAAHPGLQKIIEMAIGL